MAVELLLEFKRLQVNYQSAVSTVACGFLHLCTCANVTGKRRTALEEGDRLMIVMYEMAKRGNNKSRPTKKCQT